MGSRPRSRFKMAHNTTLRYHHLLHPVSYQTDATPFPIVAPISALDDTHARMDRLEQRMRQMRTLDGAISLDDFDVAPVASLSAQFRMLEIERYIGIGCPKIHLRLYSTVMRTRGLDETQLIMLFSMSLSGATQHWFASLNFAFNTNIDVSRRELEVLRQISKESTLYGIEEGIAKGLWLESSPFDSKEKKPSRGQRLGDVKVDTKILPARYTFEPSFLEAHGGWFVDSISPMPIPQPVPPRFRMYLHYHCIALRHAIQDLIDQCLVNLGQPSVTTNPLPTHSMHAVPPPSGGIHDIDFVKDDNIHMLSWDDGLSKPIVLDDGYEVDTMGSQTSTPFSLISY
ncbi:hypothetical protein AAG906_005541 [Vitis piasezkii]